MDSTLSIFESIKQNNEHHQEYWSARDLAKALKYTEYRNFEKVIKLAKKACDNSGISMKDHFVELNKMIKLGKTASRDIKDYALSRYACYLIMQNADPSKEIVAIGQTYFAIQTRRQELSNQLIEDQKRVFLRDEITTRNKHLAVTASRAGVKNFGTFTNYGYMGLYGGLKKDNIQKKKRLKSSDNILDYMGGEELAANLFRATQTDAKIERERISGEAKANQTHFQVGRKIRQTIKEIGGTMPELLPTPDKITNSKKRLKEVHNKTLKG